MVLIIEGVRIDKQPESITDLEHTFPILATRSKALRDQPSVVQSPSKLLYVQQREFAVVSPADDSIDILGSEDATTCHLLVLRHTGSGVTALSHFDGCGMDEGLESMIAKMLTTSRGAPEGGRIEAHVIGGFIDDRKESVNLFQNLFDIFRQSRHDIHIITACVCDANDVIKPNGIHYPLLYGVGVNCKTGALFPATFPDKGPDTALRSARHFTGQTRKRVLDIYDAKNKKLVIEAFEFDPWEEARLWLIQPDDFILNYLSTSPNQEPMDFVPTLKETLRFIVENPSLSKDVFPDGASRVFEKDADGKWVMAGRDVFVDLSHASAEESEAIRKWVLMAVQEWMAFLVLMGFLVIGFLLIDYAPMVFHV